MFNGWGVVIPLLIHPCNLDRTSNNTNNPLIWGNLSLVYHINSPMLGRVMSLQLLPPKGTVITKLVGFNLGALMLLEVLKVLVMSPLSNHLILPNKVDMPYANQPKMGGLLSFPTKWVKIPNRGCTRMWTPLILEYLMVVLVCMQVDIHITNLLRTSSNPPNFHFCQL